MYQIVKTDMETILLCEGIEELSSLKGEAKVIGVISTGDGWYLELLGEMMPKLSIPEEPGLYLLSERYLLLQISTSHSANVQMFNLLYILSSVILYNTRGPIDEPSLSYLDFITEYETSVKFQKTISSSAYAQALRPAFIWCMSGVDSFLFDHMSSEEYLESIFTQKFESSIENIIDCLQELFISIECLSLPNPYLLGSKKGVTKDYKAKVTNLNEKALNIPSKKFGNKAISYEFVEIFTKTFVKAPNKEISFSWKKMIEDEYEVIKIDMQNYYSGSVKNLVEVRVYEESELVLLLAKLREECIDILNNSITVYNQECFNSVIKVFDIFYKKWYSFTIDENRKNSENFNTRLLDAILAKIQKNTEKYARDIPSIEDAWAKIIKQYSSKAVGPSKLSAFCRNYNSLMMGLYKNHYLEIMKNYNSEMNEFISQSAYLDKKLDESEKKISQHVSGQMALEFLAKDIAKVAEIHSHSSPEIVFHDLSLKLKKINQRNGRTKAKCTCLLF